MTVPRTASLGIALMCSTALSAAAPARKPVVVMGIALPDATLDLSLTQALSHRLHTMGEYVQELTFHSRQNLSTLGCWGASCAAEWQSGITHQNATLVGVDIKASPRLRGPLSSVRVNLWRIELESNRELSVAFLCRDCAPAELTYQIGRHATELIEHPTLYAATCPQKSPEPPRALSPSLRAERMVMAAFAAEGDRSVRERVVGALKRHLALTGREVVVEFYSKPPVLAEVVQRYGGRQGLAVEVKEDGKIALAFLDPFEDTVIEKNIDCFGCTVDELTQQAILATGVILDRCIGTRCASPLAVAMRSVYDPCESRK